MNELEQRIYDLLERERPDLPELEREAMAVDLAERPWRLTDLARAYGVTYGQAARWNAGRSGSVKSYKEHGIVLITPEEALALIRYPSGPHRRLTVEQAEEVRGLVKEGVLSAADIGRLYGVGESLISRIASGERYV